MVDVLARPISDMVRFLKLQGTVLDLRVINESYGSLKEMPRWIPWSIYVSALQEIRAAIPGDPAEFMTAFSQWSVNGRAGWAAVLRLLASTVVSPTQVYDLVNWNIRANFPCVKTTLTKENAGRLRMHLKMHGGAEPSLFFYEFGSCFLRHAPELIGYPPSEIELNVSQDYNSAEYLIRIAGRKRLSDRMSQIFRSRGQPKVTRAEVSQIEKDLRAEYTSLIIAREKLQKEVAVGAELLAKSRSDYAFLMENVPDSIVTINRDRIIDYINRTEEPWTRDQVVGVNCLEFIPPDLRQPYDDLLTKVFATGAPGEMDLPVTDGTVWRVRVVPLSHAGQIDQVMAISTDVTEAAHASSRLAEARDLAVSANNAKSAFLANVSHELRTPITAILGFSELLRESPALRDADRTAARTIFNNSLHLKALIDDLLDISKIEAGSLELTREDFSPSRLVTDTLDLFSVQARAKGIELICETCETDESTLVSGDVRRIKQILVNLIGNAVKFTDAGFVSVFHELRPSADGSTSYRMFVRIRDSGPGIAPGLLGKIFEPFEQGDQTLSKKQAGTGLGLFLSREIAHLMNGEVWIEETRLGAGTAFCLELEVRPVGAQRPPSAVTCPKILVVEDNADIARLLEIVVRSAGMEVRHEERGDLAIKAVQAENPDLIIMDLQLPVMDGYEAVKILRSNGYERPILGLTANARTEERQRCLDAGFSDCLGKPLDRDDLIHKIRALLTT